jgi:hypothetical protein
MMNTQRTGQELHNNYTGTKSYLSWRGPVDWSLLCLTSDGDIVLRSPPLRSLAHTTPWGTILFAIALHDCISDRRLRHLFRRNGGSMSSFLYDTRPMPYFAPAPVRSLRLDGCQDDLPRIWIREDEHNMRIWWGLPLLRGMNNVQCSYNEGLTLYPYHVAMSTHSSHRLPLSQFMSSLIKTLWHYTIRSKTKTLSWRVVFLQIDDDPGSGLRWNPVEQRNIRRQRPGSPFTVHTIRLGGRLCNIIPARKSTSLTWTLSVPSRRWPIHSQRGWHPSFPICKFTYALVQVSKESE